MLAPANRLLPSIVLSLFLAAASGTAHAQTWSRTYAGASSEGVLAVGETAAGELRLAAWTDSFGTATGDGWLLGLAADGELLLESVIGEASLGGADGAAIASDGGALFVGRNVVDLFTKHDAWAVRVDSAGAVQWGTLLAWPGLGRAFLHDAVELADGGWWVVGTSGENDFPPQNAWLVRLDDAGSLALQVEHGSGAADTPRSIAATADGGVIVAGSTTAPGAGGTDVLLVKHDPDGAITWQVQVGGSEDDEAYDVIEVSTGGYAVAGLSQSFTASGRAPWLLRFDASGNLLWHVVFGDDEWGDLEALTETQDGGLVALGRIAEPGLATNDLWAVKLAEADGTVLWERAYEGESGDRADALLELGGGELLLGATWAWGFAEEATWLLRTDSDGLIPGCPIPRDTALPRSSPRVTPLPGPLTAQPPQPLATPHVFETAPGGAVVREICTAVCAPLVCDSISVEPEPACEGSAVLLTAELSGGQGPFEVLWDVGPDPDIDAMGNPAALALGPGMHDVIALITDSCDPMPQQCMLQTTVTVHPDQTPVIVPDGPTAFCAAAGESLNLDAGADHPSHRWSLDGLDVPSAEGRTVLADRTGSWRVRVVDSNGCTWTSAPIEVDAELCAGCPPLSCETVTIEPEPACAGEVQVFTVTDIGGEGTAMIDWDFDGDGLTDAVGNPAAWSFPEGTWPVRFTLTDACADPAPQSCTRLVMATVHPDQTPLVEPSGPTELCAASGESLSLDAGPGHASYEWLLDGAPIPMSDLQVLPVTSSGSHVVRAVDANGCTWSSAPVIVVTDACECATPLACLELVVDPPMACEGEAQSFHVLFSSGGGSFEVSWDFDEDGVPDATGNPVQRSLPVGTTRVSVRVVDAGCPPFPNPGCTLELDVSVAGRPDPTVTANGATSFCADGGESVVLETEPGHPSYQWSRNGVSLAGEAAESLLVVESGSYTVSVVSAEGCSGSSAPVAVDATDCGVACASLSCSDLIATPGPPCDPSLYRLEATISGGQGVVTVEWDVDGDGLADAFGNPAQIRLATGDGLVTLRVRDQCPSPGPRECTLTEPVDVEADPPAPGEVSDVVGGDPPLLVEDSGRRLVFEDEASALGYDLHVGSIGSWYSPRPAGSTACHREDVTLVGDGTAVLAADLPAGSWIVVSASDACAEGPAGSDSFGVARAGAADWEPCGAMP